MARLDPRHRGAHEYVGEACLMVGKMVGKPARAREHMKALQAICVLPCEELEDLRTKVGRYQRDTRKP